MMDMDIALILYYILYLNSDSDNLFLPHENNFLFLWMESNKVSL